MLRIVVYCRALDARRPEARKKIVFVSLGYSTRDWIGVQPSVLEQLRCVPVRSLYVKSDSGAHCWYSVSFSIDAIATCIAMRYILSL